MERFVEPVVEVVMFSEQDIVTTSGLEEGFGPGIGLPDVPIPQ